MSDAMTDISYDQRRAMLYGEYLEALITWLRNPNDANMERVMSSASTTDSVRRGYFTGQTNIGGKLQDRLMKLKDGDKEEWGRLLSQVHGNRSQAFKILKKISPFDGQLFIVINYGMGFMTIEGETEDFFSNLIRQKGWKTGDCDDYAVILPLEIVPSDIIWLRCGISGINGPRQA